eukprot:Gb_33762 [translate_table: standard]
MLTSTNDDLKKHIEECTESNEITRMELQDYTKVAQNDILNLENDLRFLKQACMERKKETTDMQLRMDSILEEAASKTLLRGQDSSALGSEWLQKGEQKDTTNAKVRV